MKIVAVVPARMDSRRRPGKVLQTFLGESVLTVLNARLRQCKLLDHVEVLTTIREVDEPIRVWGMEMGIQIRCTRLPVDDVLGRFQESAIASEADILVRANADSPLLDPYTIDRAIELLVDEKLDCVTGKFKYSGLPPGLLGDVLTSSCLFRLNPDLPENREHVTPQVFDDQGSFRWRAFPVDHLQSSVRALLGRGFHFTLDTDSDFDYVESIAHFVHPSNP